jgi:hypothetical protein
MNNRLETRILEMTLAALGAVACGAGAPAATKSANDVPRATEVARPTTAHAGDSSCSAAACGAKTDDSNGPATLAKAAEASSTTPDVAPATLAESPSAALASAPSTSTTSAAAAPSTAPAPKPAAARPKRAKKAAADDGCGAGSCSSRK